MLVVGLEGEAGGEDGVLYRARHDAHVTRFGLEPCRVRLRRLHLIDRKSGKEGGCATRLLPGVFAVNVLCSVLPAHGVPALPAPQSSRVCFHARSGCILPATGVLPMAIPLSLRWDVVVCIGYGCRFIHRSGIASAPLATANSTRPERPAWEGVIERAHKGVVLGSVLSHRPLSKKKTLSIRTTCVGGN